MKKPLKIIMPELKLKYKKGNIESSKIITSESASKYLRKMFEADTLEYREEFIALFLSRSNETIGWFKVGIGGVAGVVVDAKVLFSAALLAGASGIVIAHNHPSGTTKPSEADKRMTTKLVEGAKILDMNIIDHLIITKDDYYSFADSNQI